jgi:hypothetical protein
MPQVTVRDSVHLGSDWILPVLDTLWEFGPHHCLESTGEHIRWSAPIRLCPKGFARPVLWRADRYYQGFVSMHGGRE